MKGDLPIPYIVGLIIAVAVIVVVVYLFLTQSGVWQNIVHQKYCEAKCFEWQNKPESERGSWPSDPTCTGITCTPPTTTTTT